MSFTLRLREIVIGWSDLDLRDHGARIARGEFRPGLGYELVEPIFVLKPEDPHGTDALERESRYRRARDTLALSLHGPDGAMIDTARIDILRDRSFSTTLALEVAIVDRGFWARVRDA
jgi:hypothetical protein